MTASRGASIVPRLVAEPCSATGGRRHLLAAAGGDRGGSYLVHVRLPHCPMGTAAQPGREPLCSTARHATRDARCHPRPTRTGVFPLLRSATRGRHALPGRQHQTLYGFGRITARAPDIWRRLTSPTTARPAAAEPDAILRVSGAARAPGPAARQAGRPSASASPGRRPRAGRRERDGDPAVAGQQAPGVDEGQPHQAPGGVVAQGVALRRLVEVDRRGGVADVQVEHVPPAVVPHAVEGDAADGDAQGARGTRGGAHGRDLRGKAVRIRPRPPA